MIEIIVSFVLGIAAGMYAYKTLFFKKREMSTDDCVRFLKDKGYWVNINVNPDNAK